jgi:hypothetical protein
MTLCSGGEGILTHEKYQLPTPHRHHSRPEMDSMPGKARATSCRRCWASLKTSALRLQHASVRPRSSPWLTSATYAVLARPCAACEATVMSADVCR